MWGDYYPEDDRRGDERYAFEVTCSGCGAVRLNTDGWCPCGSSGESYDGRDAARWNEHLRRDGR
jgi:hypothetical protein